MASRAGGAKQRLMTELRDLQKEKWVNIDPDQANLFRWRFALIVINPDSDFYGAYLRAEMTFTDDYPYSPPKFRFLTPVYHANVYPDGQLCISILHKPGNDNMSGEEASERWSPLQGVESVLRSVLLLLDDPEIGSPANVDAGILYRDYRAKYQAKAKATVEESQKDMPDGFVMPATFDAPPPQKMEDDDAFWAESDEEFDFGGSDTGEDDEMEDFEEDKEDASEDEES
ncbi:uncharacterized protein E0L32_001888 [Thyridium curvatum]|uniref:UBC core domain-containing protein n=1 Tax=Thyridium curvatum TaxID=1093900 RepID=A0A507AL94_9PEZI|nr:uncharacterized protein E0L32_001791 [Thyridium curvatum]XP_030990024.1 uncharacterized protein E0L32_001888 [Thyridium curvatum]TPX08216.1 hypothetical protein E0L32_001791 [Thyridium curvatum]TPX08313.1 hypothetical protein E0L32_001888 [Thyridium curvatum]